MLAPMKSLPLTTPAVVPSLRSTPSAVTSGPIRLSRNRLRSLRSGLQPLCSHQLLWALPTYTPSPYLALRRPVSWTRLPLTRLSVEKARRWMPSCPMWWTAMPWTMLWAARSAMMPFSPLVTLKPLRVQWSAPSRWST